MGKLPLVLNLTISSLLSLAVTLANYQIFQRLRNMNEISAGTNRVLNLFEAVLTFFAGIIVFYQIFLCIVSRFPVSGSREEACTSGKRPGLIFLISFAAFWVIYLVYLFLVVYPGNVTSDSVWQLAQIGYDMHTNHHPY